MCLAIRSLALSRNIPLGSPVSRFRMISPPNGFGVSRVTPARRMAALLATAP